MLRSQGDNLRLALIVEQRIDMDQQRISTLFHRPIECLFQLRFGAGIDDNNFDTDAATGGLEGLRIGGVRIFGIDQYGDDRRLGVQQPEQLDAFRSKLAIDEGYPGDIATRPVEAGDQPVLDWIAAVREHDRNFAVADFAAITETTLPVAKIASTGRLTSSAASAGSLSY